MNAQVHDFPKEPPEQKPQRRRMISITNQSPISIIEDEWPVIAEAAWASGNTEGPWWWRINIKVRQHKNDDAKWPEWRENIIIHAVYDVTNEPCEEDMDQNYIARVGRVLTMKQIEIRGQLWKHVREVGEELRVRVLQEHNKKYVTLVVDKILGELPAYEVP